MTWEIPCRGCGGVAALYVGERPPRETDMVDYRTLRHVDGTPIRGQDLVACDSCQLCFPFTPPASWPPPRERRGA